MNKAFDKSKYALWINPADVKPYERNVKQHDEKQIRNIVNSIKRFGWQQDTVITSDNVLVIGHGRRLAALKIGCEMPYHVIDKTADELTDEDIRELRIADNQTNAETGFDLEMLGVEISDLDFAGFDFDFSVGEEDEQEQEAEAAEVVEDDYDEDNLSDEPKSKPGDIYQLGRHRLMCGDSTDKETVEKLMDGVKADMVFTDPPYGMKKESKGVLNDNLNYDDLLDFNRQWIPLTFGALKDNGSWYCWGIDEPLMDVYSNILKPMAKENKITFRNLITWDKGNGQGQLSEDFRMYPIADEKCLFVMCGEQDMRFKRNLEGFNEMFEPIRKWFEDERKKSGLSVEQISKIDSTRCSHYWAKVQFEFPTKEAFCKIQTYCVNNGINAFGVEYEEIKKEYQEIKKEFYKGRAYFDNTHDNMNDVWHFNRTSESERENTGGHATPKPIALCSRAIKSSSKEGEIVLDVFGGSGSTLIACEQLNRTCYMMELDPHYCDVIIDRWEKFTGEKAVLLNGE